MTCRGAKKSILEYSEGTLPAEKREEIRLHLGSCRSCAALLEKIELSGRVLASVSSPVIGGAASARILREVRSEVSEPGSRGSFWRSRRTVAIGATAAAVVLALAVVVGIELGGGRGTPEPAPTTTMKDNSKALGTTSPSAAAALPNAEQRAESGAASSGGTPMPVVKVSSTDYTPQSLRTMVESLPVRRQFADGLTMSDAAMLRATYTRKAADEFLRLGQDGAELEAMISYITATEPVMLPCYVESALFGGRRVWVIGLAAPPRSGKAVGLSRTEMWVMDPASFEANPDGSVVFFLEYK